MSNLDTENTEKIDFESWYALREKQIPSIHYREIIKADFRGQGLSGEATVADFDAALKKYGVKLLND